MNPDRAALAERVKKILRLAKDKGASPEEAATAAAMAQKLIDRYRLTEEMLRDEKPSEAPPRLTQAVIYTYGAVKKTWAGQLCSALAKANGCFSFFSWVNGEKVHMAAGQAEDLQTVAYMAVYLVEEVERLAQTALERRKGRDLASNGKVWGNNFRLGCVETIVRRIHEMKEAEREAARSPEKARAGAYEEAMRSGDVDTVLALDRAGPTAGFDLVRVDAALARLDARRDFAKAFAEKENPDLAPSRPARFNLSVGGYLAGRKAGEKVNLSRQNKVIRG